MLHRFLHLSSLVVVLVVTSSNCQNPGDRLQQAPVLNFQNMLNDMMNQIRLNGFLRAPQLIQAILTQLLTNMPTSVQQQQQDTPNGDLPEDKGVDGVPLSTPPLPESMTTITDATTTTISVNTAAVTTTPNSPTPTSSSADVEKGSTISITTSGPSGTVTSPTTNENDDSAEQHRDEICRLPPVTGFCRGYIPSYNFDPTTQQCRQFIWGGCGGNGNRFHTEKECMDFCRPAGPPGQGN